MQIFITTLIIAVAVAYFFMKLIQILKKFKEKQSTGQCSTDGGCDQCALKKYKGNICHPIVPKKKDQNK